MCPVCGGSRSKHFADERIEASRLSTFSYASRKNPEFMCFMMVRCLDCDTVYVPDPPEAVELITAYAQAAYDSAEEAEYAAQSYFCVLSQYLHGLPEHGGAVEIGAGNGAFLPYLKQAGFRHVVGIEPSCSALRAASPAAASMLEEGGFSPRRLLQLRPSLVCSFMTMEHLPQPRDFVASAHEALTPGGLLAVVVHDWRALVNRIFGNRSPIIDIEHLQLYSRPSIRYLFEVCGFHDVKVVTIRNRYPLRYWLRLSPFPAGMKSMFLRWLDLIGAGKIPVALDVGNLLVVGRKGV